MQQIKLHLQARKLPYFILSALILVGAFTRFYNVPERAYIGGEPVRDYVVSYVAARDLQLPLTGPWSSIGPITTGPWYWYYLTAMRFVLPVTFSPWYALGLASVAMIPMMYRIGVLLRGRSLGLILATLATFAPTLIEAGVYLTNPWLVAFVTSLMLMSFLQCWRSEAMIWRFLVGFLTGVGLLIHYQGIGLLVIVPTLLLLPHNKFKSLIYGVYGLLVAGLPMIFFELNNNYFNTKNMLDFYLNTSQQLYTPRRWLTFASTDFPKLWAGVVGGEVWMGRVLIILSAIATGYLAWLRKLTKPVWILLIVFLIQVWVIRYWKGEIYVARIQFLVPWMLIFSGLVFEMGLRISRYAVVMILIFFGLTFQSWSGFVFSSNGNIKAVDRDLAQLTEAYPGEKFAIVYCDTDYLSQQRRDVLFQMMLLRDTYAEDGKKIAVWTEKDADKFSEKEAPCNPLEYSIEVIEGLWDISNEPEATFATTGWRTESVTDLYDRSVKWWYKEKP